MVWARGKDEGKQKDNAEAQRAQRKRGDKRKRREEKRDFGIGA